MSNSLNRLWRLIATAISFSLFGLGGLLIPVTVVPIVWLMSGDKLKRQQRGRIFIHYTFRAYVWVMKTLGVLSYSIVNKEKLKGAQLVLANHPSLIDVVFLISFIPQANCVVKSALLRNFFTRGPVTAAGYIINDDSADEVIAAAGDAFANGQALIVFPEGTRSIPGKRLQLKRGASNIAVRTGGHITPVIITCNPVTLTKGEPWYSVPKTKPHFSIRVDEVIEMDGYIDGKPPTVAARNLTEDLTEYFNREVGFGKLA